MGYVVLANDVSGDVLPACNFVRYDDRGGFRAATEYLVRLGHRDIWFIGDTSIAMYRNRYAGYLEAMQASNLEPRAYTIALADDAFDNGHASMSYILEHNAPITAVVAGSDDIAHGAKDALRQHGKDVPKDVSLIGFEQSSGARAAHLTSVQVDMAEVGRQWPGWRWLVSQALGKISFPLLSQRRSFAAVVAGRSGTAIPWSSDRLIFSPTYLRSRLAYGGLPDA